MAKPALDKDLKKFTRLESATHDQSRHIAPYGLVLVFLAAAFAVAILATPMGPTSYLVVLGAMIAGYMALNVGANDVANNMGPAVGGKSISMVGAIVIAAICEAAGALLAGGDVVSTVSSGLLVPGADLAALDFILVMLSASLASAMWIHLATFLGAPVSTTHSVVGGVLGAGMMALGINAIAWPTVGTIAASWAISPLLGGAIAAALLQFVEWAIFRRADRVVAAGRWVPILIALMSGIFAMYLANKGLKRLWSPQPMVTLALGVGFAGLGWVLSAPFIRRQAVVALGDRPRDLARLFRLPLIFATALLSFAHGANDVANAVGPLAGIVAAVSGTDTTDTSVALPIWVLLIGAVGISLGLSLFGPRLIRTVGEKITRMNELRAYCVALSAAGTVLVASALGLPVSSTHIAVGAVFGVGLLREYSSNRGVRNPAVQPYTLFLKTDQLNATPREALENFQVRERRRLVRRKHVVGIVAAWVITLPFAASLAAMLYAIMTLFVSS
ncbi:phosphate transporter [Devosia pacifica]|uniref:Phosphate transporter n=1 Tax=Devosia pacifica TaxID=1335967 RepID=A0A918VWG8_9HYPH|nr:inorganic phosphate transporter [Devosia pacifica]GHA31260.1 phosphate transporter [Devosia pacifica]